MLIMVLNSNTVWYLIPNGTYNNWHDVRSHTFLHSRYIEVHCHFMSMDYLKIITFS